MRRVPPPSTGAGCARGAGCPPEPGTCSLSLPRPCRRACVPLSAGRGRHVPLPLREQPGRRRAQGWRERGPGGRWSWGAARAGSWPVLLLHPARRAHAAAEGAASLRLKSNEVKVRANLLAEAAEGEVRRRQGGWRRRAAWAGRDGARSPAPPSTGLRRPRRARALSPLRAAAVRVRRWARHSVRCWSHATEGAQTRHVAGSWPQQRLLRASASFTDASRSSCWWPRLSGAGCAGMWATWCGDARVWSTPFGGASRRPRAGRGSGRRRPPSRPRPSVGPQLRARLRDTAEMPQVSGEGSKMSQHSRPQVRALRASRGLSGYEGDCDGSRRRPAPTRRARRAHNRAWVCWALASGHPAQREERAGVQ